MSAPTHPALTASAFELARDIRTGARSSLSVVEAHIRRIRVVNPLINAVVCELFEEARRLARLADRAVREADEAGRAALPPLHGVPCTIKESFSVRGLPHTAGIVARKDHIADVDATLVARLKEAGAIVLGTTNVPEGLMWFDSYNHIYGATDNPHRRGHMAGGSSGGEGAVIAAAGSPLGIGSDVGGSIRLPSAFNGIVGHKPSPGRLPMTGQYPESPGPIARYNSAGPMGRRVSDLRAALRLLQGPDGLDPTMDAPPLPPVSELAPLDPRRTRVLVIDDIGYVSPDKEVLGALRATADGLQARGFDVRPWAPEAMGRALDIWSAMMHEAASFAEILAQDRPEWSLAKELLVRWPLGRSEHIFPSLGLAAIERLDGLIAGRLAAGQEAGRALRRLLIDTLGDDGVVLAPVFPRPPPRRHWGLRWFYAPAYTAIFNVMQLPCTAVPGGGSRKGLPIGLQVVGGPLQDDLCLSVAEHVEADRGGWRPAWVVPGGIDS